jgi:hypothetical protein
MMPRRPKPDDAVIHSGSDFVARSFPPIKRDDPRAVDLDPQELGVRVAREAIARLRSGAARLPMPERDPRQQA